MKSQIVSKEEAFDRCDLHLNLKITVIFLLIQSQFGLSTL